MKSILIAGITAIIFIALVLYFAVNLTSGDGIFEEEWGTGYGDSGLVNGSWGTKVQVNYEDGSTEVLGSITPIFGVSYQDKKVDNFQYILSSKITSDTYNSVELDLSGFSVIVSIPGYESEDWYEWTLITEGNIGTDEDWYQVYTVQVFASELDRLDVDRSYNLTFTPSGSVGYRTSSTGDWISSPLPSYFYVNFNVKSDYVIEVEISSGTGT